MTVPTPEGSVQLTIPPHSSAGRKLRLKGKGLPSDPPGDSSAAKDAYGALAKAFAGFNPRRSLES